ncbi:hypothetical protein, partial [Salmonella sp. s51228]|uniref:hypothetical protein n=1 Tax=Salmonella sp. s51228 TaxID=3159652 RepID=UPI00397EE121
HVSLRGLNEIAHIYRKSGKYTVQVIIDETISASLNITVVQRVTDMQVTHLYGLETGEPGQFEIILKVQNGSILDVFNPGTQYNIGYLQFRVCFDKACNDSVTTCSFTF